MEEVAFTLLEDVKRVLAAVDQGAELYVRRLTEAEAASEPALVTAAGGAPGPADHPGVGLACPGDGQREWLYLASMRVLRGKIVAGQVVLEGEPLPEGAQVTVYAEEEGGFHLDEDSLRELLEAQAEIRRGHFISAEDVLRELKD